MVKQRPFACLPPKLGVMIQFELRIFFGWGGEKHLVDEQIKCQISRLTVFGHDIMTGCLKHQILSVVFGFLRGWWRRYGFQKNGPENRVQQVKGRCFCKTISLPKQSKCKWYI